MAEESEPDHHPFTERAREWAVDETVYDFMVTSPSGPQPSLEGNLGEFLVRQRDGSLSETVEDPFPASAREWAFDETIHDNLVFALDNPVTSLEGNLGEYLARRRAGLRLDPEGGQPPEPDEAESGPNGEEAGETPPDLIKSEITIEEQKELQTYLTVAIADHYHMRRADLYAGDHKRKYGKPRRVARYALRHYAKFSTEDTGRIIGGVGYKGAHLSIKKVENDLPNDVELQRDLAAIRFGIPEQFQRYVEDGSRFDQVVLENIEKKRTREQAEAEIEAQPAFPSVPMHEIINEVCGRLGVSRDELVAKRHRVENYPLQIAILLADQLTDLSNRAIGEALGERSSVGITRLIARANEKVPDSLELSTVYQEIEQTLLVRHGIPVDEAGRSLETNQGPLFDDLEEPLAAEALEVTPGSQATAELEGGEEQSSPSGIPGLDEVASIIDKSTDIPPEGPAAPGEQDLPPEDIDEEASRVEADVPEPEDDESAAGQTGLAEADEADEGEPAVIDDEKLAALADGEDDLGEPDEEPEQAALDVPTPQPEKSEKEIRLRRAIRDVQDGQAGAEGTLTNALSRTFQGVLIGERVSGDERQGRLAELRADAVTAAKSFDLSSDEKFTDAIKRAQAERLLAADKTLAELRAVVPEPLAGEEELAREVAAGSPPAAKLLEYYRPMIQQILGMETQQPSPELREEAEQQFLVAAKFFHTSQQRHFGLWCARSVQTQVAKRLEAPGAEVSPERKQVKRRSEQPGPAIEAGEEIPDDSIVLPLDRDPAKPLARQVGVVVSSFDDTLYRARIESISGSAMMVDNLDVERETGLASKRLVMDLTSVLFVPANALNRMRADESFIGRWLTHSQGYHPDSLERIEANIRRALEDPVFETAE